MSNDADMGATGSAVTDHERQARQWGMFLHLSQFAGYLLPGLGFIAPILIWQMKKAELPELDPHGKNVVNWLISLIIYLAVSSVLAIVLIGIPLLIVLGVLAVVFPIIGAIKANSGETWKYPLTISLLK
jgi:uncharacterized Tic20 family protein